MTSPYYVLCVAVGILKHEIPSLKINYKTKDGLNESPVNTEIIRSKKKGL